MFYVGVDLAWGPVNRTGVAVVAGDGRLEHLSSVITDDEIIAAVGPYVRDRCVVAVDAPLLVTNEKGCRPAEARLNAAFQRFEAGARPAYRAQALFDPPRGALLARRLDLDIDPRSHADRRAIEVYPHPATVSLFRLGRTLKYKRGNVFERAREMSELVLHIEGLADGDPALDVVGHDGWVAVRGSIESATKPAQLDRAEDQVDAVLCAYIAMFFDLRRDDVEVFGDYPDNGYIVTPRLPADVKAHRVPAATRTASHQHVPEQRSASAAVESDVPANTPVPAPACPCGCGQSVRRQGKFVPGHDAKALHARIAQQWGNTLGFIEWFDETYGFDRS